MTADLSPLLARDSDQPTPWLSCGPAIPDDSAFSRLITQTNLQIARRFPTFVRSPSLSQNVTQNDTTQLCFAVSTSATLYTIFIGYVIAAYLADTWQETVLEVTVANYEPVDFVLKQTSFASLLQESNNFGAMLLLWVTSLVIPCVYMILLPLLMVHDFTSAVVSMHPCRLAIERLATTGLLIVWVLLVRNLALKGMTIQTTTAELLIRNRSEAGLTTFCLGVISCIAALGWLRYTHASNDKNQDEERHLHGQHEQDLTIESHFLTTSHLAMRSPPSEAFRSFPPRPPRSLDDEEIRMSLLEDISTAINTQEYPVEMRETPEILMVNELEFPARRHRLTFCRRVATFQLGLFSNVLWIPSLYIPIFSVKYHGLGAAFLKNSQQSLFLWSLASLQQALPDDDRLYASLVISVTALLCMIVIPVTCGCLGVLVWLGEDPWRLTCRRLLYTLQPALGCGVLLPVALMIALPTLSIGDSTQVCRKLLLDTECLDVSGEMEIGAYFYAMHAIVLELFVCVTWLWADKRQPRLRDTLS
jgi:hypothetical protein